MTGIAGKDEGTMRKPTRPVRSAVGLMAVAVLLVGCNATSRWSSTCDVDNTCTITIQGDRFHDFPRPYDADHGLESADRIRLVSATEGGQALLQAGGVESTCAEGESFVIVDTTITCDVVGDNRVELTTTRP